MLRRWSLDELPQLLNVLRGEMSLVGPRPLVLDEDDHVVAWGRRRLDLKPGITGLWQIRRTRRQGNDFQEWIKYDLEYVEKASWRLDLSILMKTVLLMIRKGTRQ
jgi:lipopolysaccharide/colanic/teichoic acid biosynthesis glycosyltransferase